MKRANLKNRKFGRWLVLKDAGNDKWGGSQWLCKCDCGTKKIISRHNLLRNSNSCGCLQKELLSERAKKFSGSENPNYGNGYRIKGANNPNWKGGIAIGRERGTRYKQWRREVFERDNFVCQLCGKRGGHKEAHHIYPFAKYINLRFKVWNGVTLCKIPCHESIKGNEYKFINKFLNITSNIKVGDGQ